MITELKSIITLASTWVVVVKNDTEVCMYSILLSGFIEVKPALTPLRGGEGGGWSRGERERELYYMYHLQ